MPDIEQILRDNLTPQQFEAAMDPAEEVLTLACAGSGKSRTLAFRIARLIAEGEDAESIVAFTFTEKAAESIKLQVSRALSAAGLDPTILGAMYIGTIHSYCQYVLGQMYARYRQFDVLDDNRVVLYLISRRSQLGLYDIQQTRGARYFQTIKEISNAWKIMNDEMVTIEDVISEDPLLGQTLQELDRRLDEDEFIDFSLMIRRVAQALQDDAPAAQRAVTPLKHLMVDEYQDINPSQEALITELHRSSSTLFVVGDDDQSIYAWRGADVTNILQFSERYPNCSTHTVSLNFRSTSAIVTAADDFAAAELGATRTVKNPEAENPAPTPRDFRILEFDRREEEADWVASRISDLLVTAYEERDGTVRGLSPADIAILMRSTRTREQNGTARHAAFTSALAALEIPYSLEQGGGIFDRPQVATMRNTFELLRSQTPNRTEVQQHFNNVVLPTFPNADFDQLAQVLAEWGRQIHTPRGGPRRRVYPQELVHDLLSAFGLDRTEFDEGVMQDLGVFSQIIQDVETVYLSVDSASRYREILNFLQNVADSGYNTGTNDILNRPDAITVSTVHRVKGLEFPVVFIVDTESGRFPTRRRSYRGWLPPQVIQEALDRGAYQGTRDEEARLFYTALTRAERYIYITCSESLPGGKKNWKLSPFSLRLSHDEISDDLDELPEGLGSAEQRRRIDETVVPTSYSDIQYYLRCPRDYQLRKRFGFSPPIGEMFGFGMTVHTAVGRLHEDFQDNAPTDKDAEEIARAVFHLKHVPQSRDPENRPGPYERARDRAAEIAKDYAATYAEDFARRRQVEVRFEVPVEQAVLSGAIDLILSEDEEGNILDASVVDFKTLEGGEEPTETEGLDWTELALQVQLYAKAAQEVLGENARTGAVHLLRDNQRVEVPVSDEAIDVAVANVEWTVDRIIADDFPMRPSRDKCAACDFRLLCLQVPEEFGVEEIPPAVQIPGRTETRLVRAFSEFEDDG